MSIGVLSSPYEEGVAIQLATQMPGQGRHASITEMSAAEKIDRGYLGRLLQLTLLAPEIVEAILAAGGGAHVGGLLVGGRSRGGFCGAAQLSCRGGSMRP